MEENYFFFLFEEICDIILELFIRNGENTLESFENFLLNLKNYEKTRNINHFKGYTLDNFQNLVNIFIKNPNPHTVKISVVGTNGKGSVSNILWSILKSNLKVGLYTSPHLISFTERIKINSLEISHAFMNDWFENLNKEEVNLLQEASYFEILTLLAMIYFDKNLVDVQIIEAGLGGRLDATRCFYSDIVVITKIALDHTEILGNTIGEILNEKLGIVSEKNKKIFFMKQNCISEKVVQDFLLNKNFNNKIEIYEFNDDIKLYNNYLEYNYKYCNFICENIKDIYKEKNQKDLKVNLDFKTHITISGRMEILRKDPIIIFDVSHNPSGIENLLYSVSKSYLNEKWDILLGVMGDKDIDGIFRVILNSAIVNTIYLLIEPPFINHTFQKERIIQLKSIGDEFFDENKNNFIVTGSFRLYPKLKRILANN